MLPASYAQYVDNLWKGIHRWTKHKIAILTVCAQLIHFIYPQFPQPCRLWYTGGNEHN